MRKDDDSDERRASFRCAAIENDLMLAKARQRHAESAAVWARATAGDEEGRAELRRRLSAPAKICTEKIQDDKEGLRGGRRLTLRRRPLRDQEPA